MIDHTTILVPTRGPFAPRIGTRSPLVDRLHASALASNVFLQFIRQYREANTYTLTESGEERFEIGTDTLRYLFPEDVRRLYSLANVPGLPQHRGAIFEDRYGLKTRYYTEALQDMKEPAGISLLVVDTSFETTRQLAEFLLDATSVDQGEALGTGQVQLLFPKALADPHAPQEWLVRGVPSPAP